MSCRLAPARAGVPHRVQECGGQVPWSRLRSSTRSPVHSPGAIRSTASQRRFVVPVRRAQLRVAEPMRRPCRLSPPNEPISARAPRSGRATRASSCPDCRRRPAPCGSSPPRRRIQAGPAARRGARCRGSPYCRRARGASAGWWISNHIGSEPHDPHGLPGSLRTYGVPARAIDAATLVGRRRASGICWAR